MQTASRELSEELLSNLKTALRRKKFPFDLKLVKRHAQLYRLCVKNKIRFLFIHVSRFNSFLIPPPWEEISHFIFSENMDWSVMLLKEGKNQTTGFLIPGDDFRNMKSVFRMTRMGLIRIGEEYLSAKYCFNSWDSFSDLLNL